MQVNGESLNTLTNKMVTKQGFISWMIILMLNSISSQARFCLLSSILYQLQFSLSTLDQDMIYLTKWANNWKINQEYIQGSEKW